jgi:16S rRNA (guanine966-N2)-methyltransferase
MLPPRPRRSAHTTAAAPVGKVRIIAGSLRGSRLAVPDRPGLRPTPDRVRETLFNWLAPVIDGARVLDLFAGSGALGIEALSRGAASAVFCERDSSLGDALQANLVRLGQAARAQVLRTDAMTYLQGDGSGTADGRFDVVFLDPPYALDLWQPAAEALQSRALLAPHALIYVESPPDRIPPLPSSWAVHRESKAGNVRFALYRAG